eukprot:scaffold250610_cov30-Tisochrysis_lutea.AAC.15
MANSGSTSASALARRDRTAHLALSCSNSSQRDDRPRYPRGRPRVSPRADRESPRRSTKWETSHAVGAFEAAATVFINPATSRPAASSKSTLCMSESPPYEADKITADTALSGSTRGAVKSKLVQRHRSPASESPSRDNQSEVCHFGGSVTSGAGVHENSYMWRRPRPASRKPGSRLAVAVVDGGERGLRLGRREVVAPHRSRLSEVSVEYFVRLDRRSKVRPSEHVLWPAGFGVHIQLGHQGTRLVAGVEPSAAAQKWVGVSVPELNASNHFGAIRGTTASEGRGLLTAVHFVEASPHPCLFDGLEFILVVVADRCVKLVLIGDVCGTRNGALNVKRDELFGARLKHANAHFGVNGLRRVFVRIRGDG